MAERLCLVTDRRLMGAAGDIGGGGGAIDAGAVVRFADAIARALDGVEPGAAWVQVREKDLGGRALVTLVRAAIAVARPRGARVVVNDRLDVALAAGADGVHLPEDGLDIHAARAAGAMWLGCSRHGVDGAVAAAAAGVDVVQLGPVFATPSKERYGPPLGPAALTAARAALDAMAAGGDAGGPVGDGRVGDGRVVRMVAVGGIDGPARARSARAAGADAVAVIRAVWAAADPAAAARALAEA